MFTNSQIHTIWTQIPNTLHLLITAVIMLTVVKINERATLYIKTQYLILLLLTLGIPLARLNVNNILPIYFLLELGTILFILLTLKGVSSSHMGKYKKNIILVIIPITSVFLPAATNFIYNGSDNNLWFDVCRTTLVNSEFVFWSVTLLRLHVQQAKLVFALLIFITVLIIYIKTQIPTNVKNKKLMSVEPLLMIQHSFYFTKKNILTFFKPN